MGGRTERAQLLVFSLAEVEVKVEVKVMVGVPMSRRKPTKTRSSVAQERILSEQRLKAKSWSCGWIRNVQVEHTWTGEHSRRSDIIKNCLKIKPAPMMHRQA